MTIRRVTVADLAAVRAQLIATWHATYDAIYGVDKVRDITSRWHSLETLTAQVERRDAAFLLASNAAGCVLASSFAAPVVPDVVHLFRLYVSPAAQGGGIGRDLMAATFAAVPQARVQRLEVEPSNTRAVAFYERSGFKLVGQTSDCGGASGVPALIMERQVTLERQIT